MFIYLSEILAEQMSTELERTDSVVQAVQNLAQARAQGDHLISGDDRTLQILARHHRLSVSTRGVFQRIREEQSKFGALRHRLTARIEVDSFRGSITAIDSGGVRRLHLPLTRFQRNDVAQPTFLVAENLHDCRLLLRVASWVCATYFHGKLPSTLRAVLIPGGGDTTDRVLKHLSDEQRYLTLCFTDSDVLFPGGQVGQTAKKCAALALTDYCAHFVLRARAAENLLGSRQIRKILETDHERTDLIRRLDRITHLANTPSWLHLPLKDGVREFVGPPRPNSEQAYWHTVAQSRQGVSDGYILPGISGKLLSWAVEHLQQNDPELLDDDVQLLGIWRELAETICAWTCGSQPMRS